MKITYNILNRLFADRFLVDHSHGLNTVVVRNATQADVEKLIAYGLSPTKDFIYNRAKGIESIYISVE